MKDENLFSNPSDEPIQPPEAEQKPIVEKTVADDLFNNALWPGC